MFKKFFCNIYVRPLIATILIPLCILLGAYVGFVTGLREIAKATLNACDAILDK